MKKITSILPFMVLICSLTINHTELHGKSQSDSSKTMISTRPTAFGVLKTRFEYDFQDNLSRFSVRNARIGIKGQASEQINYQFQIELSNNGKINILDLYTNLKLADGLTLTVGQAGLPIYNSYTVSPGSLMFANRPFIGKFFTSSREIGTTLKYALSIGDFPIALEAGLYNGGKINDPQWTDSPSYAGRLTFGSMEGFRATAKAYRYPLSDVEDYFIWGADLRYEAERWRIESEWMNKHNYASKKDLSSYYLQGGYAIPCQIGQLFDHLLPAARWDAMGYDILEDGFQVNRLTLGIGFGLTKKMFSSILRLDYELYTIPEEEEASVATYFPGEDFHNKLTLELLINF